LELIVILLLLWYSSGGPFTEIGAKLGKGVRSMRAGNRTSQKSSRHRCHRKPASEIAAPVQQIAQPIQR
jgi:hypothetical protein